MKNQTMTIKSAFSNAVHKLLEPNISIKKRDRWKQPKTKLSDFQKIALFNQIVRLHSETTNELSSYWFKRREKKRIQKARIARGYVPKKRTAKSDYLKQAV